MKKIRIFVVGDSTLASFNDYMYYYPRFGYGTKLSLYLNEDVEVINLALSGRSSKSYILEDNYKYLKDNIKENDYLIIGFGHNDEKEDDISRFTFASKDVNDPTSFSYSLYHNYVKLALDANAIPILSTPIVRLDLNNLYIGNNIHITSNGDYRKSILELGKTMNVDVVDLTLYTLNLYKELGYEKSALFHAIVNGKKNLNRIIPDLKSVDKTHLNEYGAMMVSYLFFKDILNSDLELKKYICNLKMPNENDLKMNPLYHIREYKEPDFNSYKAVSNLSIVDDKFIGTAFGNLNSLITSSDFSYFVKKEDKSIIVGETNNNGCICSTNEGYVGAFMKVDKKYNFTIEAKATILKCNFDKQTGFGLMLRDDCYLNQETKKEIITSNYIMAGFITEMKSFNIIFKRESATELSKENNVINDEYKENEEALLKITRLGQLIKVTVIFRGNTYTKDYLDFDLFSVDFNNMYIGLTSTKGNIIKYDDISFKIDGLAINA